MLRSDRLQPVFSVFPGRWPGAGLVLLRGMIGIAAVVQAVLYLAEASSPPLAVWLAGVGIIACGASLVVGFLTLGCGAALSLMFVALALGPLPSDNAGLFLDRIAALFAGITSLAIILLGPGAFSLDARLFGRREIVIPHSKAPKS